MYSKDVDHEVSFMLWSAELGMVRRSFGIKYWDLEAAEERAADVLRNGPRLESVADHSWHICDLILVLAPHFPFLNILQCLKLAIIHDKLEIITGDLPPKGMYEVFEGDLGTPADHSRSKRELELAALKAYLAKGDDLLIREQEELFQEYMAQITVEANFVNALDKLQVYSFLYRKKRGNMEDAHIEFTLRYMRLHISRFPGLVPYALAFEDRVLDQIAEFRKISRDSVDQVFGWPGEFRPIERSIQDVGRASDA